MVRLLPLLAALTLASTTPAAAQLIPITPETFAKIHQMADDARKAHPASPNDAMTLFIRTFNADFGDIMPVDTFLVNTPALSVMFTTPLTILRGSFLNALQKLEPLPTKPMPNAAFGGAPVVGLTVTPKQMTAPNIRRIVVFRDGAEVETISDVKPKTFTNRMGASTQLGAGTLIFRASAFAPGGTIKVVAITDGAPMEWTLSPQALAAFR